MEKGMTSSLNKLSRLLQPGGTVETLDGTVYRVVSKLASAEGISFRLADLQGNPVPTPANFHPVAASVAKFARMMRFLAFNKDFDLYVKEYIKAAGLPVDDKQNWARWFQSVFVPKLVSNDEEVQDEAIHQTIITVLGERKILDPTNPLGFRNKINEFPEEFRSMPLEKQVTVFLEKSFKWRAEEANRYIEKTVFQEDAESMWGDSQSDESNIDHNLLDTEENAVGSEAFDHVEAEADFNDFRKAFVRFLTHRKLKPQTADKLGTVLEIYWEEAMAHEGNVRIVDMREAWHAHTGLSYSYFKKLCVALPKLLRFFVRAERKQLGENNLFVKMFSDLRKMEATLGAKDEDAAKLDDKVEVMSSQKTADTFEPVPGLELETKPLSPGGQLVKDSLEGIGQGAVEMGLGMLASLVEEGD